MSKLIYISAPYGGNEHNKRKIELIIKSLVAADKDNTYISPVNCFGYLYNDVSYTQGLNYCLDLLNKCDCMQVYGEYQHSIGCRAEIAYARDNGIPFEIIEGE